MTANLKYLNMKLTLPATEYKKPWKFSPQVNAESH